ncbi:MAG: hypothetical protein AAF196_08905 [Planctomycetota bacterium]
MIYRWPVVLILAFTGACNQERSRTENTGSQVLDLETAIEHEKQARLSTQAATDARLEELEAALERDRQGNLSLQTATDARLEELESRPQSLRELISANRQRAAEEPASDDPILGMPDGASAALEAVVLSDITVEDNRDGFLRRVYAKANATNQSDRPIRRFEFSYDLSEPGRTVPWDEGDGTGPGSGGLEPGETREIFLFSTSPSSDVPDAETLNVTVRITEVTFADS